MKGTKPVTFTCLRVKQHTSFCAWLGQLAAKLHSLRLWAIIVITGKIMLLRSGFKGVAGGLRYGTE